MRDAAAVSKVLHIVPIRAPDGRCYGVETYITRSTASDWRQSGVIVHEVENLVPVWVAALGRRAVRIWCFGQDIFNFKNPWRRSQ